MDYQIVSRQPSDVTAAARKAFEALVRKGGEVNPVTLPDLVANAFALGFVEANGG